MNSWDPQSEPVVAEPAPDPSRWCRGLPAAPSQTCCQCVHTGLVLGLQRAQVPAITLSNAGGAFRTNSVGELCTGGNTSGLDVSITELFK